MGNKGLKGKKPDPQTVEYARMKQKTENAYICCTLPF